MQHFQLALIIDIVPVYQVQSDIERFAERPSLLSSSIELTCIFQGIANKKSNLVKTQKDLLWRLLVNVPYHCKESLGFRYATCLMPKRD